MQSRTEEIERDQASEDLGEALTTSDKIFARGRANAYHEPVKPLPGRVVDYIRTKKLLKPGHRTAIAVSAGLDSVALLHLALELRSKLGIVLSVAHFNHQLRGQDSRDDQQFVAGLAERHGLEFYCHSGNVKSHSRDHRLSLEAGARKLRYQFFRGLIEKKLVDRLATAHTLDDQAETVILRLARGSGTRGLAGVYPRIECAGGYIIRPLLQTRRAELQAYLQSLHQPWREDESNHDPRHTRNRVRHTLLPLLERELNPSLCETLAETAELARDEEDDWEKQVDGVLPRVSPRSHCLKLSTFLDLSPALQRRVVRRAAAPLSLEQKHVARILEVANGQSASTELPASWLAIRRQGELHFERCSRAPTDYEYPLPVPGSVEIPELHSVFEATPVSKLEAGALIVRNWRAGDRFWPVHRKGSKKVKELLQEKKISGSERHLWPVVVWGSDILWLRGFPPSSARDDLPEVSIRECPLPPSSRRPGVT